MKRSINLFITILILSSCSDLDNNNLTADMSQSDKDRYTGFSIIDAVSQIYNINLAGKPVGAENLTTSCPIGGNVTVTGNTGYSQNNDITTVDLTFVMTDCHSQKHTPNNIDTSIVLNGTITFKGSFRSSTGYAATNYQSDSLKIKGTIKIPNFKEADIDETCKFAATVTDNTVSGTICSRSFSY